MEDVLVKRVMPHSLEAEQSVIGSMIMDKEAIVVASEIVTAVYQNQIFTIVEEKNGWGRLKSGAGWISLNAKYVIKL